MAQVDLLAQSFCYAGYHNEPNTSKETGRQWPAGLSETTLQAVGLTRRGCWWGAGKKLLKEACWDAVARTIVCMERSYVTAAFFRHRTYERYRALQQQQQAARLLGEGAPPALPSMPTMVMHVQQVQKQICVGCSAELGCLNGRACQNKDLTARHLCSSQVRCCSIRRVEPPYATYR